MTFSFEVTKAVIALGLDNYDGPGDSLEGSIARSMQEAGYSLMGCEDDSAALEEELRGTIPNEPRASYMTNEQLSAHIATQITCMMIEWNWCPFIAGDRVQYAHPEQPDDTSFGTVDHRTVQAGFVPVTWDAEDNGSPSRKMSKSNAGPMSVELAEHLKRVTE